MINSALTCEIGKIGIHVNIWKPFIAKLLSNLSKYETGIIYVLFGAQAKSFKPYINEKYNDIIEVEHPAYFARTKSKMPYSVFTDVNKLLYGKYGKIIEWYKEVLI